MSGIKGQRPNIRILYKRVLGVLCLGHRSICIISCNFTMHYGRLGEKGAESLFEEVMAENFSNLKKETNTNSLKA